MSRAPRVFLTISTPRTSAQKSLVLAGENQLCWVSVGAARLWGGVSTICPTAVVLFLFFD